MPSKYPYCKEFLSLSLPCLCPSVGLSQYSATSTSTSTSRIPPICTAALISAINQPHYRTVPHTSTVLYCTVLAPSR